MSYKHKKFQIAKDGEWIQPVMRGYLMECCDCGLVHRMDFRIVSGIRKRKTVTQVQFRASRANGYTARARKRRK